MFHFSSTVSQNHGESVYKLAEQSNGLRRNRYFPGHFVSRFARKVRKEACCRKSGAYKTMGCPKVCLNQPHSYLKKFSGAEPCFWKKKEDSSESLQNTKSLLADKNQKICNSTCPLENNTPKAKVSQSGKCNRFRVMEMKLNANSSHSQPLLTRTRSQSCQTNSKNCGESPENGKSNSNTNSNTNSNSKSNSEEEVGEEEDWVKFGQDLSDGCTCANCTCSDPSPENKVSDRIPVSWNGGFMFIERGRKDYIRDNALAVIRTPPRIPQRRIVDGRDGHSSEWVPRKLLRKIGFGTVPRYIRRVKGELYQRDLEMKEEIERRKKYRALNDEERRLIVKGLEMHWKEIFDDYRRLPLFTRTPKIERRKSELEANLQCVEKDIQLFKRNGPLFVANVAKSYYL